MLNTNLQSIAAMLIILDVNLQPRVLASPGYWPNFRVDNCLPTITASTLYCCWLHASILLFIYTVCVSSDIFIDN